MHVLGQKRGRPLAKSLALALALLSLLFLLQVTPHGHANGQDEAACRLCQAAHMGVIPTISGIVLSIPLAPISEVEPSELTAVAESFFNHSDPRAPPVEVQF
jgi:hypothetical protein